MRINIGDIKDLFYNFGLISKKIESISSINNIVPSGNTLLLSKSSWMQTNIPLTSSKRLLKALLAHGQYKCCCLAARVNPGTAIAILSSGYLILIYLAIR